MVSRSWILAQHIGSFRIKTREGFSYNGHLTKTEKAEFAACQYIYCTGNSEFVWNYQDCIEQYMLGTFWRRQWIIPLGKTTWHLLAKAVKCTHPDITCWCMNICWKHLKILSNAANIYKFEWFPRTRCFYLRRDRKKFAKRAPKVNRACRYKQQ